VRLTSGLSRLDPNECRELVSKKKRRVKARGLFISVWDLRVCFCGNRAWFLITPRLVLHNRQERGRVRNGECERDARVCEDFRLKPVQLDRAIDWGIRVYLG